MGLFTHEEKMNMQTGKFETTKKGLFVRKSKPSDNLKPQIREYKLKEKKQRKKKRDATIKSYKRTGNKIVKGAKAVERWGNSFDKPKQSNKKTSSKTVLLVDSSGRIIGTRKMRSKSKPKQTRRSPSSDQSSAIDTDYFFGSSKGSGKNKKNKKNSFDSLGGWI